MAQTIHMLELETLLGSWILTGLFFGEGNGHPQREVDLAQITQGVVGRLGARTSNMTGSVAQRNMRGLDVQFEGLSSNPVLVSY